MTEIRDLLVSENFMKELAAQATAEDVIALFAKYGVTIGNEEVEFIKESLLQVLNENEEMNEEALDMVSGGGLFSYQYKCSCGEKFRTEWFASFHMVRKNAKNIVCGDGGFTFCTSDGHTHTIREI